MTELLSCPFCGGTECEVDITQWGESQVHCECGARGPVVVWEPAIDIFPPYDEARVLIQPFDDAAREAWNRRVTLHVRFTKSEVAHEKTWPFVLLDQGDKPTP